VATTQQLQAMITEARTAQLAARASWAHSPNTQTIAGTRIADRRLNVLLDRLSAALKNQP
jgi:hypothetical protein